MNFYSKIIFHIFKLFEYIFFFNKLKIHKAGCIWHSFLISLMAHIIERRVKIGSLKKKRTCVTSIFFFSQCSTDKGFLVEQKKKKMLSSNECRISTANLYAGNKAEPPPPFLRPLECRVVLPFCLCVLTLCSTLCGPDLNFYALSQSAQQWHSVYM